jgi:hypothetical protein
MRRGDRGLDMMGRERLTSEAGTLTHPEFVVPQVS